MRDLLKAPWRAQRAAQPQPPPSNLQRVLALASPISVHTVVLILPSLLLLAIAARLLFRRPGRRGENTSVGGSKPIACAYARGEVDNEKFLEAHFPPPPPGESVDESHITTLRNPANPYNLYIGLQALERLHDAEQCHTTAELVVTCGLQAYELMIGLIIDALEDGREEMATLSRQREQKLSQLVDGTLTQLGVMMRLLEELGEGSSALANVPWIDGQSDQTAIDQLTTRSLLQLEAGPAVGGLPSRILRVLDHLSSSTLNLITKPHSALPFALGLEQPMARLRAALGFPLPAGMAEMLLEGGGGGRRCLAYDVLVRPAAIADLPKGDGPVAWGPEDRIFCVVHQVTECWLAIANHLGASALTFASAGNWPRAAAHIYMVAHAVRPLGAHIHLLDWMLLRDFHPLRVALYGASGAQSAGVWLLKQRLKALYPPLRRELQARLIGTPAISEEDCTRGEALLVALMRSPGEQPELFSYYEALNSAGMQYRLFFFNHLTLAQHTLGSQSIGSIGVDVMGMVQRLTSAFLPEVDRAKFEYHELTNFAYGHHTGDIIDRMTAAFWEAQALKEQYEEALERYASRELPSGSNFAEEAASRLTHPTPLNRQSTVSLAAALQKLRKPGGLMGRLSSGRFSLGRGSQSEGQTVDEAYLLVERYFGAIGAFDQEAWLALWTSSGFVQDPIGSKQYRGHSEQAIYFRNLKNKFKTVTFTPEPPSSDTELSLRSQSELSKSRAKASWPKAASSADAVYELEVNWSMVGTAYNGRAIEAAGTARFGLVQRADRALVHSVVLHWNPKEVAEQVGFGQYPSWIKDGAFAQQDASRMAVRFTRVERPRPCASSDPSGRLLQAATPHAPSRPLGVLERLPVTLNETGEGLNIVSTSRLSSESALITSSHLEAALAVLQRRHPLLRARFVQKAAGDPWWVCDNGPVPITVCPRPDDDEWQRITNSGLLSHRFDLASAPPLLCHLVGDNSTAIAKRRVQELILTFCHAVCDAQSVREVHREMVAILGILLSRGSLDSLGTTQSEPLPPPCSALAAGAVAAVPAEVTPDPPLPSAKLPSRVAAADRTLEALPVAARKASSRQFVLQAAQMSQLVKRCKGERTTVHGAICAAHLIAAHEQVSGQADAAELTLNSFVDLRRRFGVTDTQAQALGLGTSIATEDGGAAPGVAYYVGGIGGGGCFNYGKSTELLTAAGSKTAGAFWDLARKVKQDVEGGFVSGQIWLGTKNIGGIIEGWTAGGFEDVVFGTLGISNVGAERFVKDHGVLRWEEFHYAYGTPLRCGPGIMTACSGFDGKLFLSLLYVEPCLELDFVRRLGARIVELLEGRAIAA